MAECSKNLGNAEPSADSAEPRRAVKYSRPSSGEDDTARRSGSNTEPGSILCETIANERRPRGESPELVEASVSSGIGASSKNGGSARREMTRNFEEFCKHYQLTQKERRLAAQYLAFIRMLETLKLAEAGKP